MTITAAIAGERGIQVISDDGTAYFDSVHDVLECLEMSEDDVRACLEGKHLRDDVDMCYAGGYGCAACLLNGIDIEESEALARQDALKGELAKAFRATQALWLRGELLVEEGLIMRLDAERRHMIEARGFAAMSCTCEGTCNSTVCGRPYVRSPNCRRMNSLLAREP